MSKDEALSISAMEGRKIKHRFFDPEEYIAVTTDGNIKTEEGFTVSIHDFFYYRKCEDRETGWSIVE